MCGCSLVACALAVGGGGARGTGCRSTGLPVPLLMLCSLSRWGIITILVRLLAARLIDAVCGAAFDARWIASPLASHWPAGLQVLLVSRCWCLQLQRLIQGLRGCCCGRRGSRHWVSRYGLTRLPSSVLRKGTMLGDLLTPRPFGVLSHSHTHSSVQCY